MIDFLKRLFCRHNGGISFVRNIYGDEINACGGNRSIHRCKRCGGAVYMPGLCNLSTPPAASQPEERKTCREPDGRCGICGGDWSVCGCQGMLDRSQPEEGKS